MFKSLKTKFAAVLSVAILVPFISAAPSQAETFKFMSGPTENLDPAGAKVNGGFASFPKGAGMYMQQCIAPVAGNRPVTCDDINSLWVTASGEAGSLVATGPISMPISAKITGKGVSVDCTVAQCGIFFRLDRTAGEDKSEDKFIPITFRKGAAAAALPADEVTVALAKKTLVRNVPTNLSYRGPGKIVASSKSGLPIIFESLTPDCTYSKGTFKALKGAGECALAYSTAGNESFAASRGNFPFILVPGVQKISRMPKGLVKNKPKALPYETNFGTQIKYKSLSKNCAIELNLIQLRNSGKCKVQATAAAKEGMWQKLSITFSLPAKSAS
ncbi:MAG: hypothetical protein QNL07_01230 [Candidatus Planktophila sp.]